MIRGGVIPIVIVCCVALPSLTAAQTKVYVVGETSPSVLIEFDTNRGTSYTVPLGSAQQSSCRDAGRDR